MEALEFLFQKYQWVWKKVLILLTFSMCDKMISQWAQIGELLRKTELGNAEKDSVWTLFTHPLKAQYWFEFLPFFFFQVEQKILGLVLKHNLVILLPRKDHIVDLPSNSISSKPIIARSMSYIGLSVSYVGALVSGPRFQIGIPWTMKSQGRTFHLC